MLLTAEALPIVRYSGTDVQYTRFPVPSPDFERPDAKIAATATARTRPHAMDILSPAEAEFAFIGSGKENHRQQSPSKENRRQQSPFKEDRRQQSPSKAKIPSRVDSRLSDHQDDRGLPLVSPLEPDFPIQNPGARTAISSHVKVKKLDVLEEHKSLLPIFVHFKTNVIVKDEFSLVTELSALLAKLYFCSEDGIVVSIDHSACLMLAGSFDPAYVVTISTTSDQLKPDANRSNTQDIQKLVQQILNVRSYRGMIRFSAVDAAEVGFNGTTVHHLLHRTPRSSPTKARRQTSVKGRGGAERATSPSEPVRRTANPLAPRSASASQVLSQQISAMSSVPSSLSGLSESTESTNRSSHVTPVSPMPSHISHQLNFHKPRPASMYSTIGNNGGPFAINSTIGGGGGGSRPSSRPGSALSMHRENSISHNSARNAINADANVRFMSIPDWRPTRPSNSLSHSQPQQQQQQQQKTMSRPGSASGRHSQMGNHDSSLPQQESSRQHHGNDDAPDTDDDDFVKDFVLAPGQQGADATAAVAQGRVSGSSNDSSTGSREEGSSTPPPIAISRDHSLSGSAGGGGGGGGGGSNSGGAGGGRSVSAAVKQQQQQGSLRPSRRRSLLAVFKR